MATMDITPQELRDIEIREAWRGYHRDDVDELLERAAATIEHLEDEIDQLRSRPAPGPQIAAPTPPPRPAPQAAPAPPPPPAPAPAPIARTADTDVIQRTLVLAQKAADEAVAEAKAKAAEIVAESESKATQLVADAEANARRIAETEKAKLELEIEQLTTARDTLSSDVDALERFEAEYRERLRVAIEAELEHLARAAGSPPPRPTLSEVDLPEPTRPVAPVSATAAPAPTPAPAAPATESWSASQEGAIEGVDTGDGPPTVHIEAVAAYPVEAEPAWDPAPAGGWSDAGDRDADADFELAAEEMTGESLDDDAFFASLREAVRDDAPLGAQDDTAFFDQEDTDEHRKLFKRRR
jgi:DivIVA domain-containing protein